jgi:predicted dithiol-disulfide oxidoreductase (DUF899 family)
MVQVTKSYTFTSNTASTLSLADLFSGRKQLVIYHFMLEPGKEVGCHGCSFLTDNLPSSLTHLNSRDTTFVLVSRAPIEEIEKFRKRMGWTFPWYSSFGTEFNYDFGVTLDPDLGKTTYNYVDTDEKKKHYKGEFPGLSVFYEEGGMVYHTYSTYERGLEGVMSTYRLLDMTPLGRRGERETEPDWKLHDEY